nr:hypothetical protein [Orientia tsutsugamushi]
MCHNKRTTSNREFLTKFLKLVKVVMACS